MLFALLNYVMLRSSSGTKISNSRTAINSAIMSFSIIMLPLLRSFMKVRNDGDFDFWILVFILMAAAYLIRSRESFLRLLRIVLIILSVFFASYLYGLFTQKPLSPLPQKTLSPDLDSLKFTSSPNIYLFVYDGMPNERVFRDQNLPFDRLNALIEKHGFKLYKDTYTLGEMSMDSMGNLLDFSNHWRAKAGRATEEAQSTYAGNSRTNLVLRNNGYKCHLLLENYYTECMPSSTNTY